MKKLILFLVTLLVASQCFAVDIVIKTGNLTSCDARLKQLGIVVRDAEHETPFTRIEGKYEQVNTPILEDINGDLYFTIRLTSEQAAKLPKNDTPNFATIWRSTEDCDEVTAGIQQCPWPDVEVSAGFDENGDPLPNRMQGVGRIL